ncbi:tRNA(Ile)-lysidine synthetase-like protein [Sulfobacillus acidophilus TPY]|nr:tRNA(Ile)-lysidine synthetase-like protein [Sulfobacillus acidophilus TPY]
MKYHPLERRFIMTARALWAQHTPLVVGLSGGADSLALTRLLHRTAEEWPVSLHLVHINHQLRSESASEAAWLVQWVEEHLGLPVTVIAVDVIPFPGESLEMAARRVRYQALWRAVDDVGPDARLLTAHQQDDQVETILMRILTGTGIRGLSGIAPVRGRLIRPLLGFSRASLEAYLADNGWTWLEDASNRDPRIMRNRIRHEVLPYLRRAINPRVDRALLRLADDAAVVEDLLQGPWDTLRETDRLRLPPGWSTWPEAVVARVMLKWAEQMGIRLTYEHIRQAVSGDTDWPSGYQVRHEPDGSLTVAAGPPIAIRSPAPLVVTAGQWPWGPGTLTIQSAVFQGPEPGWTDIPRTPTVPLECRTWRPGDRMRPLGLGGHQKKLQDLFIDAKIPRSARSWWPLVGPPDQPWIWAVVGIRVSEEARVQPGQPVWRLRFQVPQRLETPMV